MAVRITGLILALIFCACGCARQAQPSTEPEPPGPVVPSEHSAVIAEELARLDGEWLLVKAEPDELRQSGSVTFRGDTVTFESGGPARKFQIDPTKSPKWFDLEFELSERPLTGIYRIDGNRLSLYLITESQGDTPPERPKGFDEKCPGQILHFERVKK